jgi:hypothetical protein
MVRALWKFPRHSVLWNVSPVKGFTEMEISTSECRRFAKECRDLAKSAKTIEEQEFLREREASWISLAKEPERKKVKSGIELPQHTGELVGHTR